MHELAITEGILGVSIQAAQRHGRAPIRAIHLVIGELSSVVDDSIQFYFDVLSRGTLAAGATLAIRREAPHLTCAACGYHAPVAPPLPDACPGCNGGPLTVSGGRDCFVESIEVEDDEDRRA